MAGAGELPHTPYYGTVDSTPLWLILLGETYDWTGDRALVDRLWPNALARARLDRHATATATATGSSSTSAARRAGCSTRAGRTRATAIRDRDGALATGPIALAEVQGYVFDAKRRMAGLAAVRGDDGARRRGSMPRPRRSGAASRTRSGSRTSATTRWPSTARSARSTRSARTPASACGPGSSSPARARDVAERLIEPDDVLAAGGSGPTPRASPATTRSATTRARSGRTTRR